MVEKSFKDAAIVLKRICLVEDKDFLYHDCHMSYTHQKALHKLKGNTYESEGREHILVHFHQTGL